MADLDTPSPAPDEPPGRARVQALLPWYAVGTLDATDRAWVDQWLERHALHPAAVALRAEVAWLQSASRAAAEPVPDAQVEAGLAQLMQRIAAERIETAAPARQASAAAPASGRRAWLAGLSAWLAPRGAGLALAAVALVVVQAGVIGALLLRTPAEQEPLSGAPPTVTGDRAVLLVAFRTTATEGRLRTLLAAQQAQIVGGPSALGLYRVAVPASRTAQAVAALSAATDLVESVQMER